MPRAHQLKALVGLDQLVLAVHHQHSARAATPDAPPASKKRKRVCSYCSGRALPAHASKRTFPKRIADEAAKAAANTSGGGTSGSQ